MADSEQPPIRRRGRPHGTTKTDNKVKTGIAMREAAWNDLDALCADGLSEGEALARGDLVAELIEAEKKRRAKRGKPAD